ncbi:lysophospholipase L1-like esterase [Bifidobacterium commune]|uniref:Lysophospholipase L1 n=1 Tax=Bifidobacterium commune TaxID=1505727 RepID=A0A1C4H265_9BIFI|nr:GDSL-type esterase/lipase family protein [Bifidobacterium commune]MBB2954737.1 lysophospholipase L1-like esterase [Bifidobacterium commune]SCC78670.1 Lysophospholipase L1 [Bifidobacterium commune]
MTLGFANPVAALEAIWAKRTVNLAEPPVGEPSGTETFTGDDTGKATRLPALTMCTVGDSMVAGCGTDDQQEGLVPNLAKGFAQSLKRDVKWEAHGKLGATMRRVRYRMLPELLSTGNRYDFFMICAGSNDIMANRTLDEWRDDLSGVLEQSQLLSDYVVVLGPGQMQHEPSLGRVLRRALEHEMDEQALESQRVCDEYNVSYVNMVHEDVHADEPGFFSFDRFHPSAEGYRYMAQGVVAKLGTSFMRDEE